MFGRSNSSSARLRVKICGITDPADAELAVDTGADALGLNFYPGSPRCLHVENDAAWLRALAGVVQRIAVVVNATRAEIDRLLGENLADAVQLHGDEDASFCLELAQAGVTFAKALRVRDAASLGAADRYSTPWLVLDAFDPAAYGGTGRTLDWSLAERCVAEGVSGGWRVILSGGLTPGNVAEAILAVRPFGVDVASGVEAPGDRRRKDPARLRAFLSEARRAESILENSAGTRRGPE